MSDKLEEIQRRNQAIYQCIIEERIGGPICSDISWLIAEVERLREELRLQKPRRPGVITEDCY
jgi:hypothetical protein